MIDLDTRTLVCDRAELADTPWRRLRGLLGRARLIPGEGLILTHTAAIHTFFMRFPIDVVFLDAELTVIRTREGVRPWRAAAARGARTVLELPAGEGNRRGLTIGDRLTLAVPAMAAGIHSATGTDTE